MMAFHPGAPDLLNAPPITPADSRQRLRELARHSPIVHQALSAQFALGWSDEDTFATMAYHALAVVQAQEKMLLDQYSTTLPRGLVPGL